MNKLFCFLAIALLISSCKKDETRPKITYPEIFEVSFKLDGKQYSKAYKKDESNPVGGLHSYESDGDSYNVHGPVYQMDSGFNVEIFFGYFQRFKNDTAGDRQRVAQLMKPGNKAYKCLMYCDTSAREGVEVRFSDKISGVTLWGTVKYDPNNNYEPIPITNEQDGSSFVITGVKDATTTGYSNNALIVKGTFSCNMYNIDTGEKKVITEGKFTCLVSAY